jgi:hypothetical protein
MTAKTLIFKQFFEVVRHSYQIKLDYSLTQMDPRGMYVSENKSFLMNMADSET